MTFRLRFSFSEQDRAALLSHLEVQRALQRLVRRAALPFALSQGFSPHMKLATGPALPVGVASLKEYAEVELDRFVKPAEALARLQHAAPPLLPVLDCAYVAPTEPSLDSWFNRQACEFTTCAKQEELRQHFESVCAGPELEVVRKGKVKRYLPSEFVVGPVVLTGEAERTTARFVLRMKSTGSLRADLFAAALLRPFKITPYEAGLCRVDLYHEED
ncbi:MAG: TIGR03936 family radical SAM-associated protein [Actinomycetia bacterium]|nr:TIGR03936 family radical SAM-associated protein [Actinomycetes bacterium]